MSLVTVVVSSYNSSGFILETLESILQQTWKDLELIITDDCSMDDTIEVCSRWLSKNKSRFSDAVVLKSKINTGISPNGNRGLNAAKGEWIKFLGADDTLKPECIEDNMLWITSHPGVEVLFSRIEIYKDRFDQQNLIETTPGIPYSQKGILAPERSSDTQYKMLLLCDRIHFTPSVFIHRKTLLSVGGFDERFKLLEDYPLWLNLTKKGCKLWYMEKVTVCYRRHSRAINNTGDDFLINPNYFKSEDFRNVCTYPFLPADIRLSQRFNWYASQIFRCKKLNKNKISNRFLLDLFTVYLNPFKYYIYLKILIFKELKRNAFYMQ